ncbi:chromate transporter [Clostridia bacterium]|nr:chromate transporter [Clostridia bacterium]
MIILELFLGFLQIGAFSFGGGYAMISLLRDTAVTNGWLSAAEFSEIVALSQITPGPIAVNMATFVGYRQAGVIGALVSTLGVSLPSFVFVLAVMKFLAAFKDSKVIGDVFFGLRAAVTGLITAAAVQIALPEVWVNEAVEIRAVIIFGVSLLATLKFKANPILLLILSAVAGIVLY